MLRSGLLAAARSPRLRDFVEHTPLVKPVIGRFVAGTAQEDALAATARLADAGLKVTLDHLGEDTVDRGQVEVTVGAYERILTTLADAGLAHTAEVSLKLSALGQSLGDDGDTLALDAARRICKAASAASTTVTLDMEDHTTTDSTLAILTELRADFPWVGVAIQAYLLRSESDCHALAATGARVRLCKGAYAEPRSIAHQDKHEVDLAYVRCLRTLMAGDGYPMVATHDPRMIAITQHLAAESGRTEQDYEFQMLHGVRPREQRRIANAGYRLRVYLPFGQDFYGYFMRRLAERPANLGFFLRALATRG